MLALPKRVGIRPNGALLRCPHPAFPRYCGGVVRTAGSCEGNLSRLSSSQASYPSPRRERQGSLIPPLLLSPRDLPSAGLAWGPHLRCPSICARMALTDYSVVHFSAVQPLYTPPSHNEPHGGQHRISGVGRCTAATPPTGGQQGASQRGTGAVTLLTALIPLALGFRQLQLREKFFLAFLQNLLNWLDRIEQTAVVASAISPADHGVLCLDQTRIYQ